MKSLLALVLMVFAVVNNVKKANKKNEIGRAHV